jgi:hypothetical protein
MERSGDEVVGRFGGNRSISGVLGCVGVGVGLGGVGRGWGKAWWPVLWWAGSARPG